MYMWYVVHMYVVCVVCGGCGVCVCGVYVVWCIHDPLQYCGLENPMDCIVHGVAKSRTRLSDFHFYYCVYFYVTNYTKI